MSAMENTDTGAEKPDDQEGSDLDRAAATLASLLPTDAVAGPMAEASSKQAEPKLDDQGRAYATGKRKNAVARVWIKPGVGRVMVNGLDVESYFARATLRMVMNQPFDVADRKDQFDVAATVSGGGLSGQAGAVRQGLGELRAGAAPSPQEGWFPHPRQPCGRAQEIWKGQGPS